jgi:hypothetical protein
VMDTSGSATFEATANGIMQDGNATVTATGVSPAGNTRNVTLAYNIKVNAIRNLTLGPRGLIMGWET